MVFKNKPKTKEKTGGLAAISVILAIVAIVPLLMPVIVCMLNGFAQTESTKDNVYYVLRGIFGIALIFGVTSFAVNKDISTVIFPAFVGFILSVFPLAKSFNVLMQTKETAQQLSMTIDYTLYLVDIGLYLFLTLLALFTVLFACGIIRNPLFVYLFSVVASLGVAFLAFDRYYTFQIPVYDVICYAYATPVALIPSFIAMSVKPLKRIKKEKYQPRRIKK